MDNLMKYAMKLAYLDQLYRDKMISDNEYAVIRNELMIRHKILGGFTKYQRELERNSNG